MLRKLLTFLFVFMLMHSLTACGGGSDNWEQTLDEFGAFIDEFMKVSLNALENPTDEDAKSQYDAKQKELNLWQDKIDKLGEELDGTAEEEAYKEKLMEQYNKLMQIVANSGYMDKVSEGLEDTLGSEKAEAVMDYYGGMIDEYDDMIDKFAPNAG